MRNAPVSIDAMLGTTVLTLSRCAKIVLRDGSEFGFTDHDESMRVVLPNDFYEPLLYRAGHGMIVGDTNLRLGLDADNTEISIPINEMISRGKVLSRRFHMAKVYTFDVDWTQPTPEPMKIMAGYIAEARPENNMAVFEVRSQADRWNTVIGHLASPRCNAVFGDVRCGATPTNTPATVTDVLSDMRFLVNLSGFADDHWRFGEAEFLTGELAGTHPYEIVGFDGYESEVEVLSPMPGFPAVGDTLFLRNGCSNVKFTDDPLIPTCATHNNQRRFRGLDQLPGTDRFVRFPIPGAPGL